jgi:hypothetical protein
VHVSLPDPTAGRAEDGAPPADIRGLVLSPTRELAAQTVREAKKCVGLHCRATVSRPLLGHACVALAACCHAPLSSPRRAPPPTPKHTYLFSCLGKFSADYHLDPNPLSHCEYLPPYIYPRYLWRCAHVAGSLAGSVRMAASHPSLHPIPPPPPTQVRCWYGPYHRHADQVQRGGVLLQQAAQGRGIQRGGHKR